MTLKERSTKPKLEKFNSVSDYWYSESLMALSNGITYREVTGRKDTTTRQLFLRYGSFLACRGTLLDCSELSLRARRTACHVKRVYYTKETHHHAT